MISLYLRNILFFILQPGIVAFLVPYILAKEKFKQEIIEDFDALNYIGIVLGLLGLIIVFYCIYRFIIDGRGTLSPADKTKVLVIKGLYKYSRNPMYIGVLLILLGEIFFTKSIVLFGYSIFTFLGFHLFVIFVEEPRLKKDFKSSYASYTSKVNRWF